MKAKRNITAMRVEEIDALLGGEAQRLADQYREMPLDFMDGYGWAVTQICRLFHDAVPVRHGKWKPFDLTWGRSVYACTACGDATDVPTEMGEPIYAYCPHCGARMDAERKDND